MFKALIGICSAAFNLHSTPLTQTNPNDDEATQSALSNELLVIRKIDYLKKILPAGTYELANGETFKVTYDEVKGVIFRHRDIIFEYQDQGRKKDVLKVFNPIYFTWKKAWSPSLFEVIKTPGQVEVHHDRGVQTKILLNIGKDGRAYFIWYENRWENKHFSGMIERASSASL